MCVFEGSMPPSISVTREYGIYTAHKHKYCTFSKSSTEDISRYPKRGPNTTQKQPQRPPESKKSLRRCQGQKKANFGQPGPPSRAPKGPQIGLPSDIKSTQNHRFIRYAKNHQLWCQFRDHGLSFWKEK